MTPKRDIGFPRKPLPNKDPNGPNEQIVEQRGTKPNNPY